MANKENMTLRIDHDMSTATGIFYRQALQHHGLPFDVRIEEPNIETYAAMEDATKRKNLNGPFDSVEELMESLDA